MWPLAARSYLAHMLKPRWDPTCWVLIVLGILLLAVANNLNGGREHWRTVLQADAKGYHAYLPALLVHHDPHFGFLDLADSLGGSSTLYFDYRTVVGQDTVNKYWCGTALLQAPFYLAVHAWLHVSGGPATGHGRPYILAVCVAAIAYALIGLWAVGRIMAGWGVEARWQAITIAALMLGTHLFYYTLVAPGMSHVYSFALFALFLLEGQRYAADGSSQKLMTMGALLGLLVLVRPVNAMAALALPVVSGQWSTFHDRTRSLIKQGPALGAGCLLAAGIVGLQLAWFKTGTGKWWVDSYHGEGFQWTQPHMVDILFSYKKGLFVYTPLCMLALVGLIPLALRSRFIAGAWLAFFLLLTYVLSCWWNWWYGGSFSARPYVEYLPLFAVLLGLALQQAQHWLRTALVAVTIVLTTICQLQTYQTRYYQIHYEDMDRERYWEVFLRLDQIP